MLQKVKDIARILNCPVQTVYRLIGSGRLRAVRVGLSKGYRIAEEELQRFMHTEEVNTPSGSSGEAATPAPFTHLDSDRLLSAWRRQDDH